VYDPTAQITRLIVLHNPYAIHPLRLDILNDPHILRIYVSQISLSESGEDVAIE
jgi:hypothetical protein